MPNNGQRIWTVKRLLLLTQNSPLSLDGETQMSNSQALRPTSSVPAIIVAKLFDDLLLTAALPACLAEDCFLCTEVNAGGLGCYLILTVHYT